MERLITRRGLLAIALGGLLGVASPIPAGAEGLNNLWAGLNGIVTAPADPVMDMMHPPAPVDDLTYHPIPFFLTGTVMAGYRTIMGAFDVAMSPFYIFPTVSPKAHWDLIPWAEIEYDY